LLCAIAAALIASTVLAGCAGSAARVTIVTYNVQNLFDSTDDGTEYAQYQTGGGWTADRYYRRLIRLDRVFREILPREPEIIVLQEIEGERVISDLVHDFLRGRYQVGIAPQSDSSIQVAILSRSPLRWVRIHRSVAVAACPGPTLRPPVELWGSREMVDAEIAVGGTEIIRMIACHWKSQSGGERQTEPQRIQSAALLRTLLKTTAGEPLTLIVGDLNEDVEEFRQHGSEYPTALMPDGGADARRSLLVTSTPGAAGIRPEGVVVYSPWLSSDSPGSYYHAGRWERLDQVLLLPGAAGDVRASLSVIDDPELLTPDGRPARYDPRSGYGYSDHLPVVVEIWREEIN